ncbi:MULTISPECIES: hypothetical protein [Marinobacter]|uniref:hypothetical protein n=1 Tax=Marinobacter TaxID=2742 RepID=UPI001268CE21|nr:MULTISPECIES: hypothetical protein [Marinobacter]
MINRRISDQQPDQIVDVTEWDFYQDYEVFPSGARNKSLRICPDPTPFDFCIPGHRYLFKEAIKSAKNPDQPRHPDQYWAEVIAFKIGRLMGLTIPPTFVAIDSKTNEPGVISEWFLNYGPVEERYTDGGDHMQAAIPEYEREKGRQHNLSTILTFSRALAIRGLLSQDWIAYWGLCLCFDALIGNTDRHQENWGVIWNRDEDRARFSPYFDNGTSLGHELFEKKIETLLHDDGALLHYIQKGRHHMRWNRDDAARMGLIEGVRQFCAKYPSIIPTLTDRLTRWDSGQLKQILDNLTEFDIAAPLTALRAEFVYSLTMKRRELLLKALEELE